jgi:hypothetical protein
MYNDRPSTRVLGCQFELHILVRNFKCDDATAIIDFLCNNAGAHIEFADHNGNSPIKYHDTIPRRIHPKIR